MASTTLEGNRVVAGILAGDLDSQFAEISQAMRQRVNAGAVALRWGLKFDDLDITQDNQSLAELMFVERQTGKTWAVIQPADSAATAGAIIVAALVERQGMKADEAFNVLKTKNAQDIATAIYEYSVDPPKDGGAAST